MSNINSRLHKIEVSIAKVAELNVFSKIDSWRYGIAETIEQAGGIITLQEWEKYRQKRLKNLVSNTTVASIKNDLDKLEHKIRSNGGFMEVVFI